MSGDDAYPGLHSTAAVLLARNHDFVDGNKPSSWPAAGAFYWINGCELDALRDPAYDLVIAVATRALDVPEHPMYRSARCTGELGAPPVLKPAAAHPGVRAPTPAVDHVFPAGRRIASR